MHQEEHHSFVTGIYQILCSEASLLSLSHLLQTFFFMMLFAYPIAPGYLILLHHFWPSTHVTHYFMWATLEKLRWQNMSQSWCSFPVGWPVWLDLSVFLVYAANLPMFFSTHYCCSFQCSSYTTLLLYRDPANSVQPTRQESNFVCCPGQENLHVHPLSCCSCHW